MKVTGRHLRLVCGMRRRCRRRRTRLKLQETMWRVELCGCDEESSGCLIVNKNGITVDRPPTDDVAGTQENK